MKQQTVTMKEAAIEEQFCRANRRLMASLDSQQRSQAIQEFRLLYEEEMGGVRAKVQRKEQVRRNLQLKQQEEQIRSQQVHAHLQQRMQLHFKKREVFQLQRLRQCKQIDGQWRDRIKTIAGQAKSKLKQNALLSNRMGQEALKFWQQKEERSRVILQKKQQPKPRYFSQDDTADLAERNTHFLTEANVDEGHYGSRVKQGDSKLPSLRRGEDRGSRSVAIERPKSQIIREHLMKSSELWQQREGECFQRAMQKLEQIQQTRSKARQKLVYESQRLKRSRMHREGSHEERFFRIQREERRTSPRGSQRYTHQPDAVVPVSPRVAQQPSRLHTRMNQLQQHQFQERSRHFQLQLRKQQKGCFRKMVRQAVQAVKLQALRAPP